MKKELLSILKTCLLIILSVIVLDSLVGFVFDTLIQRLPQEGERVAKSYYAFHGVESDIVIVGSSRAETTYDCKMLMDSTPGISIYNCGGDGQGLFYCNALINSIFDRYTPRCVVWDVSIGQIGGEDHENLSLIYPYYNENQNVKNIVDELEDPKFKYKIVFNSYRYNATAARILRSYFMNSITDGNNYGFLPRRNADNSRTLTPKDFIIEEDESLLSKKKIDYVSATLERAQNLGCKVIIVVSPMYSDYNQNNIYARKWREICDKYDAIFVDDSHLAEFVHNNEYAYDRVHVNYEGAEVYSKKFAVTLASILKDGNATD